MGIGRSSAATCPRGCTDQWRKAARPARCGRTATAAGATLSDSNASARESESALATRTPRLFRSRLNQRSVTWSIRGAAKYAAATSVATSGSRNLSLQADRLQIHGRRDTPRS
jgi:hypothetical protein